MTQVSESIQSGAVSVLPNSNQPESRPDDIHFIISTVDRYNPQNIPVLEEYVSLQMKQNTYDSDALLSLLKLYQFNPLEVNESVLVGVLLLALSSLPSSDFNTCLYMMKEITAPIDQLISLQQLLETASFEAFWSTLESMETLKETLESQFPLFEENIRDFIGSVLQETYSSISLERLEKLVDLSGEDLITWVQTREGWELDPSNEGLLNLPLSKVGGFSHHVSSIAKAESVKLNQLSHVLAQSRVVPEGGNKQVFVRYAPKSSWIIVIHSLEQSHITRSSFVQNVPFLDPAPRLLALVATPTLAQNVSAIAVVKPTANSSISGSLVISQNGNSSLLQINLTGLQPNQKVGFHVHAFGDISAGDGTAAGGHYNPTNVSHGCTPSLSLNDSYAASPAVLPTNFHVGDIGNIQADANGTVLTTATSALISLNAKDAGFVIGRAVVVHAQPDDCVTQPTGNSGARLAQATIGWRVNGTTPAPETFNVTDTTPKSAIAVLSSASGSNVTVAPSTRHGLHLHAFGDISDANGTNTAGHYNPLNVTHGCFANATRHAGDLDNVESDSSGNIAVTFNSTLISLYNGAAAFIPGRGVILHSQPDDCFTQPTGNSGSRLAQGVIGFRNISLPAPTNKTGTTAPGTFRSGAVTTQSSIHILASLAMVVGSMLLL